MKTKNILIIVILIIAIAFLFSYNPTTTGRAIKEDTVKIAHLPVTHGLPLYMAFENGWFEEAGINVEIIKFESPNQIIDALLQNNIDFASGAANGIVGIVNHKNPGKIQIIAITGGSLEIPSENFVIPKEKDYKTIQDLKGKKIGILAGTIQWQTIIKEILEVNGLSLDDVTIIELAPSIQVPTLASKQIDALLALEPISTVTLEKADAKIMIAAPVSKYISNPFFGGADIVRTKFAKENPETTKKVVEIFERAHKEIRENPEDSKKYLKGHTALDDNTIRKTPILIFRTHNQLSSDDIKAVQDFYNIFTKHGVVDGKIDFEKILYNPSN
ncbi:hypothetical protein CMI42_06510 [Candidatus Pacearchaeota archaeon]|nr:hypothetical protein [Candidatus Pacearchaeota archaeon]|tara:strand:- start:2236 stop:3225 length:990 start_codon:yes stop_codon:yes gene_type:complete